MALWLVMPPLAVYAVVLTGLAFTRSGHAIRARAARQLGHDEAPAWPLEADERLVGWPPDVW
jgi:hypothetical protein